VIADEVMQFGRNGNKIHGVGGYVLAYRRIIGYEIEY
jgi:hypothetical protein